MAAFLVAATLLQLPALAFAAGYRTAGSSGCHAQMVFLPPFTDTAVFLDNYHPNYGGPGVNLQTGAHSRTAWQYINSQMWVFGSEFNWRTNALRKLYPVTNTFCAAGAFLPDGTMVNMAGSEPDAWVANTPVDIPQGFNSIRTYSPGPCTNGSCNMDFNKRTQVLQAMRWYPTAEALTNGDVLVVGGSNTGLLVLNEANINVPTYEIIKKDFSTPPAPVTLPILQFDASQNLQPNKSYNLYPYLTLLPNPTNANQVFTIAANQVIIWDYTLNRLVKTLPTTPLQPRSFPSSASIVMLPLVAPSYEPSILLCGGSSADMPNPLALSDCWTIQPNAASPSWIRTDNLPNGGQTMTDAVILPNGKILLINGAHKGCGGGYQAENPVFTPLIYDHSAPAGSRFTQMPSTNIPRMYHSVAQLLPSGEVLVAGSNPDVFYNTVGSPPTSGYPHFNNNGHRAALNQQQNLTSRYPTEYRVEIFSPPYMDRTSRPSINSTVLPSLNFNKNTTITINTNNGTSLASHNVTFRLINPGFRTHAVGMGHRAVQLKSWVLGTDGSVNVLAPPDATVMVPGVYLLFAEVDGGVSEGVWTKLS